MTKVLVITQGKWDSLTEGERGCGWSYMTEVDLQAMADDYSKDESKPWHDRQAYREAIRDVLAHIKEGQHGD